MDHSIITYWDSYDKIVEEGNPFHFVQDTQAKDGPICHSLDTVKENEDHDDTPSMDHYSLYFYVLCVDLVNVVSPDINSEH